MDDVAVVAAEIAALHRGRGLRRPDLHIGPGLHAALQLEPRASLDEVRDHLVAALRASATSLPKDLQLVFLNAAALTASDRSLGGRLSHAAAALDRDPRTIRRRLAQANVGVATALVRGTRRPVEMGNAWFIQEFEAITDLRGERPVLTARKIAVPTLGGVHLVKEGFGLPRTSPDRPDPQIRVVEGGARRIDQSRGRERVVFPRPARQADGGGSRPRGGPRGDRRFPRRPQAVHRLFGVSRLSPGDHDRPFPSRRASQPGLVP